jgi:tRNA(adenine34) deaminase
MLFVMDRIQEDHQWMRSALVLAQEAALAGEVPVGAIIVDAYGVIKGKGRNCVEELSTQSEHAEVRALREAGKTQNNWRLSGMTLYVTLEPCMMCVSLAALSKIERIVFGAHSPRYGASLDIEGLLRLYRMQIRDITPGVLADESLHLLRDSFIKARKV